MKNYLITLNVSLITFLTLWASSTGGFIATIGMPHNEDIMWLSIGSFAVLLWFIILKLIFKSDLDRFKDDNDI